MHKIRTTLTVLLLNSVLAGGAIAAPVDPALLAPLNWRLLGPFRAGWAEMIEGVPGKTDSYIFGASGGGIWRTDDSGQTWSSLFDRGGSSAIGAIAIAPSNPNVIYAGGGQPEPRYDVQSGRGVYRSSDGGKTLDRSRASRDTRYVGRIWVSPTDPDTVIVAAVGHFFGASDARGIYRSTDGGRSLDPSRRARRIHRCQRHRRRPQEPAHPVRLDMGGAAVAVAELFHGDFRAGQRNLSLG